MNKLRVPLTDADTTDNFSGNSTIKITDETDVDGTKEVKIMVLFKYSGNFWRTLEMSLINCKTIKIFNETYQ